MKKLIKLVFILPFLLYSLKVYSHSNGYNKTINISGRQRMLTQKIVKSWLLLRKDVNAEKSKNELRKAISLFEKSLSILAKGDEENGIHPPTKKLTVIIDLMAKKWIFFKEELNDTKTLDDKNKIIQINAMAEEILILSDNIVNLWNIESGKSGFAATGKSVNISGRQRMLSQRIAKLILLKGLLPENSTISTELNVSLKLFEASNNTLLKGNSKLVINQISNSEAKKILNNMQNNWKILKKIAELALDNQNISEKWNELGEVNNKILKQMNSIVQIISA